MSDVLDTTPIVRCSQTVHHEPHVWISAIVGGPPGPVPQITCICPGA